MNASITLSPEAKQSGSIIGRASNYCTAGQIVKMVCIIKRFREQASILRGCLVHFYKFGQKTQTGATRLQWLLYGA